MFTFAFTIRGERKGETGKLEGLSQGRWAVPLGYDMGKAVASITSHVLLAFVYYECITSMGFALLVALFMRMGVLDDSDL